MSRIVSMSADPESGRPRWRLVLRALEARIVLSLPAQLEQLLTNPDHNRRIMRRLFPTSYADATLERENRRLLGETLIEGRRLLLVEIRADLEGGKRPGRRSLRIELDELGMDRWLRFVNDIRLVIATDLGIESNLGDEEAVAADDPDAPRYALLDYLGGLEHIMLEALSDPG